MQLTDSEILEELLKYTKLKQYEFADKVDTHQSVLSFIRKGERELSKGILRNISKCYPEIQLRWLFLGEGEMLKSEDAQESSTQNESVMILQHAPKMPGNAKIVRNRELIENLTELVEDMEAIQSWMVEMEEWKKQVIIQVMKKGED